jgi:hypothetical protein
VRSGALFSETAKTAVLQLEADELIRSEIGKIKTRNFQSGGRANWKSSFMGGWLLSAVFSVVSGCRRIPGRARSGRGSRDGMALGTEIRAGTGAAAAGAF